VFAFGILILLTLLSGLATLNKATELHRSLSDLNQAYRGDLKGLDEIRSGIQVSSVLVRDYLLDPSLARAKDIREELLKLKTEAEQNLAKIERPFGAENHDKLVELRTEINAYWESLDPVFDLSPEERQAFAYGLLRRSIMPRRDMVLSLADQVQAFTDTAFQQQRAKIRRNEEEFRSFGIRTIIATIGLGILVALISVLRISVLERRAEEARQRTERAENEMRRLSHQLVHTQEEERRAISRELHDEVGQMLTGLRMDLRALQKVHRTAPHDFDARLEQTRVLLEQTLQSVRDIAMGLRPSMLDDLGLEAALQWQIRQFERHHEIPVTLNVRANLDNLRDRHRTTLYRVVQEALTNCARHSHARSIFIDLAETNETVQLVIQDDGRGITDKSNPGLGLIGIQERVRDLGGVFDVSSTSGKGATIKIELPVQEIAGYV
jgi:signal transduction histidine kinase